MSKEIKIKISNAIKATGYLSLSEFLTYVLYDEEKGYYSKDQIIGRQGDFITAPEISQTFGEMIASWIVLNLRMLKIKENFSFCELGPGKGTLMNDIINTTSKLDKELIKNINNVFFLEKAKIFKQMLRKKFKQSIVSDDFNNFPKSFNIIIANEFFDAIPQNQYIYKNTTWYEKVVALDREENLCFKLFKANKISNFLFPEDNLKEGYTFEYSDYYFSIIDRLFKILKKYRGMVLIFDYTKEKNEKNSTLFSIKDHKYVHPFEYIGSSDISFKLDFEIFKKVAVNNNCYALGPVSQSFFLQRLGINERFEILIKKNPKKRKYLLEQKKRLVSNSQMGEKFKVLAIYDTKPDIKYGFE